MGKHAKDKCFKCGEQDNLTWCSWYLKDPKHPREKGAWLCRKHDMQEASRYIQEGNNG